MSSTSGKIFLREREVGKWGSGERGRGGKQFITGFFKLNWYQS
jgi:hypothetical protein